MRLFADVMPVPVPGVDFLNLGSPLGQILGCLCLVTAVGVFVLLLRRKLSWWKAALVAVLILIVGDCSAFYFSIGRLRRERSKQRDHADSEYFQRTATSAAASASAAGAAASAEAAPAASGSASPPR